MIKWYATKKLELKSLLSRFEL